MLCWAAGLIEKMYDEISILEAVYRELSPKRIYIQKAGGCFLDWIHVEKIENQMADDEKRRKHR